MASTNKAITSRKYSTPTIIANSTKAVATIASTSVESVVIDGQVVANPQIVDPGVTNKID